MHVGMENKPLMKYNPEAYRSRLQERTVVMPYKNSSQVVIGNRESNDKTLYKTTHKGYYVVHPLNTAIANPGILSELTKKAHRTQLK